MVLLSSVARIARVALGIGGAALPKRRVALPRYSADLPEPLDPSVCREREADAKKIIEDVKNAIVENRSRNFAVVHLAGKQRRVTDGDLVIVEGHWPPAPGDRIRFEKVLLAGSEDFTLIGRPTVQAGLVDVTATVVGKSLSTARTHFKKKRRKQYMRIAFVKAFQTTLRINSVDIGHDLNSPATATATATDLIK